MFLLESVKSGKIHACIDKNNRVRIHAGLGLDYIMLNSELNLLILDVTQTEARKFAKNLIRVLDHEVF